MDDLVELIRAEYPHLYEPAFLQKYPHVLDVARSIGDVARRKRMEGRPYMLFVHLDIKDKTEFLQAVYEGKPAAVQVYKNTKEILGF